MYLWYRWFGQTAYVEVPSNDEEAGKHSANVLYKVKSKSVCIQTLSFLIFTLGYLAIGFSRFILGVHSANQVIYGFLLGGLSIVMCVNWVDPAVTQIMDKVRQKHLSRSEINSSLTVGSIYTATGILITTAVYLWVDLAQDGFNIPQEYRDNIEKCQGSPLDISSVET
jgi:hypothetical protein